MKPFSALPISAILAICFAVAVTSTLAQTAATRQNPVSAASYGKLPLSFEANRGQTDPSVHFLAHGQGYTLFLRSEEAVLTLRAESHSAPHTRVLPADERSEPSRSEGVPETVRIQLKGANTKVVAQPEDPQITRTNYFIGNDPARWRTGIPNYSRVRYRAVYDGVDLMYYGNQGRLEHDFIVAPYADPAKIALRISAKELRIDPATGDLLLNTGHSSLRLLKPVTYQEPDRLGGSTDSNPLEL